MSVLRDWLTGKDNVTFDPARGYWALTIGLMILAAIPHIAGGFLALFGVKIAMELWGPQGWAIWGAGIGAQLPLGAAAVAIKSKTEPSP